MNRLKEARFLAGMNQAELAKKSGLDAAIISRLENDLLRDTPSVLQWKERVAAVLGLGVSVIFPSFDRPVIVYVVGQPNSFIERNKQTQAIESVIVFCNCRR